ncbi:autotransporter outer membrane beta-barrel domain-containing protein [Zhongshania sp. BJYM1]|uniref:autotransporter outer membrane beta-barrel domain-containing protein n=1 Tax=Zhongshania aquatica TaxID=2965069 RepID=UPI0022B45DA5|nr:autotransporter outer membrane beta-barrel domain-containing protein [Marortus sp. BJYM1]
MKKYLLNTAIKTALSISCGLILLPQTALAVPECNSKVQPGGSTDQGGGEYNPPTGATGGSGLNTAAAYQGMPRVTETAVPVETPYYETSQDPDTCGATVSESTGTQAQEVAMSLLPRILSQNTSGGSSAKKGKKRVTAFDFRDLGGAAGADDADNALLNGGRFSLFSFTDYTNRDRHATSRSGGFEQEVNSFTLGFDYRIDDSMFFGMTVSGADGESKLDTRTGGSDTSSTTIGVHGAKYWGNSFVAGLIAYGALDIDIDRTAAGDSFSASTDGSYWYGDISIGFEENYGGWRITPQARALLVSGDIDAYREKSATGTGVIRSIQSQDIDSAILTLSVQADYPLLLDWGVLLPSMRVELIADGGDGYKSNGQNLNDVDKTVVNTFADQADDPDSSTVAVSWGASAQFSQGLAAYIVYERLFYHDYLNKYTATVGVRYELP